MADTSDFRRGMVIELNGTLYSITYFQHVKPGKGGAFVRTKLKDVMEGGVIDKTFRAGEKVKEVRLERRPIQYTYTDGQLYYFMNMGDLRADPALGRADRRGPAPVSSGEHGVPGSEP